MITESFINLCSVVILDEENVEVKIIKMMIIQNYYLFILTNLRIQLHKAMI